NRLTPLPMKRSKEKGAKPIDLLSLQYLAREGVQVGRPLFFLRICLKVFISGNTVTHNQLVGHKQTMWGDKKRSAMRRMNFSAYATTTNYSGALQLSPNPPHSSEPARCFNPQHALES
ncbi:MAG TPA: hypothetical protein VLA15_03605, partial [Desulfurivibrionaceae bacterium]|nr:hypothetical protein [Desulfurivibrionaceae bacterium]